MKTEEKNNLIDARLNQYEVQMFNLEIDRTAFVAVGDDKAVKDIDERLEALKTAHAAVEAMKEG